MAPNPCIRPRTTSEGHWRPPKALGSNCKRRQLAPNGAAVPITLVFRHDGALPMNQTRAVAQLPSGVQPFKTISIYHHSGVMWAVPYDATQHQVGDGHDHPPGQAPEDESDPSDEDETQEDRENWAELSFAEIGPHYLSYAGLRMDNTRLLRQRPGQLWVQHFLPDRYHSRERWTKDTKYGGLVGELPLLIGLVALSQPENRWQGLLPQTVLNVGHNTPGWQVSQIQQLHFPRGHECEST